jgi:hypothetical protein
LKTAIARSIAVFFLLLLALAPAHAVGPVMSIPGQSDVDGFGTYHYTVPIMVPPGTAGMAPHLSLSYSSNGGDGYEGLGWSLTGISAITRCARTIAQDTVHGGVNYDANDRFCLDGQRLMLVTGTWGSGHTCAATYGADSSCYRTEINNFSEVIAHGTQGVGPSWFEVHTKDGHYLQYGNSTTSQVPALGNSAGSIREWEVNQAQDTKGNYINYTYSAEDTTYGQSYITEIDYTGNVNTGAATYEYVKFTYSPSGSSGATLTFASLD